jgi:hypothetical protein
MNATYEPIETEYFFTRLFGRETMHGSAGALRDERAWRRRIRQAFQHLRRYVEANLPASDSIQRDAVHRLVDRLEAGATMRTPLLREQALVTGLMDLCLSLLGDVPDHWDRRRVAHPNHFMLNKHRTLHYGQSNQQRARLIADACRRSPLPGDMTEAQARATRDR